MRGDGLDPAFRVEMEKWQEEVRKRRLTASLDQFKAVLQLLKRKRYNIPTNIEYEYQGADPVTEVRKCFQYCKDALA